MPKKPSYEEMLGRIQELEHKNQELLEKLRKDKATEGRRLLLNADALVRVSMEIMAQNGVDGVLQHAVDGALEVTQGHFGISFYEGSGTVPAARAASNSNGRSLSRHRKSFTEFPQEKWGEWLQGRDTLRLSGDQVGAHPLLQRISAQDSPLHGLLGARLRGRDAKRSGLIVVLAREGGDFTWEEEQWMAHIASFASRAIQHIETRLEAERGALETETLFSTLTDAVIVMDESGRVVKANPAAKAAYGFDPTGDEGKALKDRICLSHLDGREIPLEKWPASKALMGQTIIKERLMLRDAEGRVSFVASTACPLFSDGKLMGGVEVLRNVTEEELLLKQLHEAALELENRVRERTEDLEEANKKLKETKALLEKTFEALDQAVFIVDPSTRRIVACNRAVETVFGYSRQELVGQNTEILHTDEEMYRRFGRELFAVLDSEGRFQGEFHMKRKDGSLFPSEHSVSEIRNDSGGRYAVVSVVRDISRRKYLEKKILESMRRLERSNFDLQDFAFVASHDLQEPLRKIQTFGNLLETKYAARLDEEGKDYLRRMGNAASRMQALIKALLSYARINTRGVPFQPVKLEETVREAFANLEVETRRTGARLDLEDLPILDADPVQMSQLFQNLMGNSIKFGAGRENLVVKVHHEKADVPRGMARILVEDNGIGFDEKFAERIFQPFERLHGRSEYDGVGMGLAICRKIVERHRGSIEARSTPGKGATFVITLPVRQSEASDP